jgi:trehalose/maltose hydrolase-like predicted phosphorylase
MSWVLTETTFDKDCIEVRGSQFLLGNGYMGYRGTLVEFGRQQRVACTLAGLYDQVGNAWREPVNAPNGLLTRIACNGQAISALTTPLDAFEQNLDIYRAIHTEQARFTLEDGNRVDVRAERFCSLDDVHLIGMRYAVTSSKDCTLTIETGVDGDMWDINGPHLRNLTGRCENGILTLHAHTFEQKRLVAVAEMLSNHSGAEDIIQNDKSLLRRIAVDLKAGDSFSFDKFVAVFTDNDGVGDVHAAAVERSRVAAERRYEAVRAAHEQKWAERWQDCDVVIEGDPEGQFALRYSMYLLLTAAPVHTDAMSIPARGLSGQVYKGAIFWDTEMFMLPFFVHTLPEVAGRLVRYRCRTLDGARRKAAEYGYRGAFYAWESQEDGRDACTLFNIYDVFTGRPIRTYFRDKQIHISADVVYGLWLYYTMTGDESILLDGGAEVILEAARFYCSHAYLKPGKDRYELLDVLGPDEYHDRVHNNAFTSAMAKEVLGIALRVLDRMEANHPEDYRKLMDRLGFDSDVEFVRDVHERLYVPEPDSETGLIDQFDGYFGLEDVSLAELKQRVLNPNEYLGGYGPASTTQIIKQADVVAMLRVLSHRYSREVKRANWEYYEPRTEHGSSLSACMYALIAAELGEAQWAYKYFLKTATEDLGGAAKQLVGDLYIGGTHPAANGGAWMTAVLGFGGLRCDEEGIALNPRLPEKWKSLSFSFCWRGQRMNARIRSEEVAVEADGDNDTSARLVINGNEYVCGAGETVRWVAE